MSDINELVEALYVNDPRYVRPHSENPLYRSLIWATWMRMYPQFQKAVEAAEAFLRAIEAERAKRESKS